jgi:hypothetical protein
MFSNVLLLRGSLVPITSTVSLCFCFLVLTHQGGLAGPKFAETLEQWYRGAVVHALTVVKYCIVRFLLTLP